MTYLKAANRHNKLMEEAKELQGNVTHTLNKLWWNEEHFFFGERTLYICQWKNTIILPVQIQRFCSSVAFEIVI